MFTPSYNYRAQGSNRQGFYDRSDNDAALDPNYNSNWAPWRYGDMTPPDNTWYSWFIPESKNRLKRIIPNSMKHIERIKRARLWKNKPKPKPEPRKPKEREEIWRYGPMTPPEKWYDWIIPELIKRPPRIWKEPETDEPEERETKRKKLFDQYGDVDSGHCAQSEDWTEQGACMCTVTWMMPGRFPRSFCETICNGVVGRTTDELDPMELPPVEENHSPEPCWEVKPVPEEPETRLCWVKQYNPRLERYEYISKPWRPPLEGVDEEEEVEEEWGFHESLEQDGTEYRFKSQFLEPEGLEPYEVSDASLLPEEIADPFPCGRKPPWLQNVHKFIRAEELASPPTPPSEFVSKSGTILAKFSDGFFKVPYYDPAYRRFRYAEPCTMDMNDLKFKFSSTAPPPKPISPPRLKSFPKRPLVMAQKKEPITIRMPEYDPRPVYEPPPVRVPVRPKPKPTPKPVENIYHRPNFVMFPPSSKNTQDDTPCPPPRKRYPKVTKKGKVRIKDNDGEYRPGDSEESEEELIETPSHSSAPTAAPKKKTRRRKRRDSDPTYKQNGVRENNRIEKKDLQQMHSEEAREDDDVKSKQETSIVQPVKPRPGFRPKPILKNGKGNETEPVSSKGTRYDSDILPSKTSKSKEPRWEPRKDQTYSKKVTRKEKGSKDSEYVAFRDREEERREKIDVNDMKKQVDKQAEEDPEPEPEPEHCDDSSKPVKPPKKTLRRRKAPEDCAYRPGRRR